MLSITQDMAQRQGLSKSLPYEAQVVDNNDPDRLCRVRARIPLLFAGIPDEHLPWAIPMFAQEDGAGPGSGTAYVPKIGTKVKLYFLEGQETSPVWEGYTMDKTTKLQEMEHNYPDRKVHRLQNKALVVIDTKSNEVFIRYPGDTRVYIEGNLELTVHGNVTEHIEGNRSSFIDGDSVEVVKGNRSTFVGGDALDAVKGARSAFVDGASVDAVKGDRSTFSAAHSETSTGNHSVFAAQMAESFSGTRTVNVGGSDTLSVSGAHTRSASRIDDNTSGGSAGPSGPAGPSSPTEPDAPDITNWTGIDGGAQGAFLKGFSINADPVDAATSIGEDAEPGAPVSPEARAAYDKAGVKADGVANFTASQSSTNAPTPASALPTSCAEFADKTTFPANMQLSPSFNLGDLSTNAVLERAAVVAQAGLTAAQIVCNLKGLAINMLEPILARYGRPTVNCGFRPATASYGSPTGWHLKGAAADIQWPGISDTEYFERAKWIKDTLPFCEIILEYGGNRPWIHVAFQASALSTSNFKTRVAVPSTYAPGILALKNVPKQGGI